MLKRFKRKRGSYFAEASLIYPIIIFITVLFIAVSAGMFINVLNACEMERAVRRAAGGESGTVIYNDAEDKAGYGVFNYELPGYEEYGGAVFEQEDSVKKFVFRGGYEYKNNLMFNIMSENKYVLYHSAVNEADVLWKRQAEEVLNTD